MQQHNESIDKQLSYMTYMETRSGNRNVNDHIGKRSRYGYYKFFRK